MLTRFREIALRPDGVPPGSRHLLDETAALAGVARPRVRHRRRPVG
jgi:hypothetical protein